MTLTSSPNSLYSECPGDIVFTCQANRLDIVFWWINSNTTPIARSPTYIRNDHLPVNITTSDSLRQGLVIILTNVVSHAQFLNNYTSIACTTTQNIYYRNISKIWCGRNLLNASLSVFKTKNGTIESY